jgi:hypothetical protein
MKELRGSPKGECSPGVSGKLISFADLRGRDARSAALATFVDDLAAIAHRHLLEIPIGIL